MGEGRGEGSRRPATERADELLNRAGWTAGLFASMIGMRLARIAAFAREEAEDMWAEAQSVRRSHSVEPDGDLEVRASRGTDVSRPEAESKRDAEPDGEVRTETAAEAQKPESGSDGEAIKATETARRRAEELGVDLREIEGTGSGGQITARDVRNKAQAKS